MQFNRTEKRKWDIVKDELISVQWNGH